MYVFIWNISESVIFIYFPPKVIQFIQSIKSFFQIYLPFIYKFFTIRNHVLQERFQNKIDLAIHKSRWQKQHIKLHTHKRPNVQKEHKKLNILLIHYRNKTQVTQMSALRCMSNKKR